MNAAKRNRSLAAAVGLALALWAPPAGAQQPAAHEAPATVQIPAGTAIRVRLTTHLEGRKAKPGDPVTFEALEDVKVQGLVVIAKGAPGTAQVTKAKGPGIGGRGGKLEIALEHIAAVDGTAVRLRPVQAQDGKQTHKGQGGFGVGSYTGMGLTTLALGPIGGVWLLKKGHDAVLPYGTLFTAEVAEAAEIAGEPPKAQSPDQQSLHHPITEPATSKRIITHIPAAPPAGTRSLPEGKSLGELARELREKKAAAAAKKP